MFTYKETNREQDQGRQDKVDNPEINNAIEDKI